MKGTIAILLLFAIWVRSEDDEVVVVEDTADTHQVDQRHQSAGESAAKSLDDKTLPKIFRKYRNIKDINKYQIVAMESMSLIRDFQDMAAASIFIDGSAMLELQRKSDEINKLVRDLQDEFQGLPSSEQKGFVEEHKQLLFNALPQRLRHFKELSAGHLILHQKIMESTIDVLRDSKASAGLVDYAESRLRNRQFSSETRLREMLKHQEKKRNSWVFGFTRLEWILLTGQVWIAGSALVLVWIALGSIRGVGRAVAKYNWFFDVALFGIIYGLVHVEMSKALVTWNFLKMRILAVSFVQFTLISILREAKHAGTSYFSTARKAGKAISK